MENLPEDHVCPSGVVKELRRYKDTRLDLWGDMLRVSDCSQESLDAVTKCARRTGDLGRLSPVDMTVIALGLDTKGTVMSDDYSILNVCRVMGIDCMPVGTGGIKKVEKWNYQCIGCRKWFKEKLDECPVCGSPMRAHRRKRSREDAPALDEVGHAAPAQDGHAQ